MEIVRSAGPINRGQIAANTGEQVKPNVWPYSTTASQCSSRQIGKLAKNERYYPGGSFAIKQVKNLRLNFTQIKPGQNKSARMRIDGRRQVGSHWNVWNSSAASTRFA